MAKNPIKKKEERKWRPIVLRLRNTTFQRQLYAKNVGKGGNVTGRERRSFSDDLLGK